MTLGQVPPVMIYNDLYFGLYLGKFITGNVMVVADLANSTKSMKPAVVPTSYQRIDVMWNGKGEEVLSSVSNVLLNESQTMATTIELNVESPTKTSVLDVTLFGKSLVALDFATVIIAQTMKAMHYTQLKS